jgi:hypothetical protein
LPKGGYWDGESSLITGVAHLLDVYSVEMRDCYVHSYKTGEGHMKPAGPYEVLAHTLESEGIKEWHGCTSDFWGLIMAGLKKGGGWMKSKEVLMTGEDHKF